MSNSVGGTYGTSDWEEATRGWRVVFYPVLPNGEPVMQETATVGLGDPRRARIERLKGVWRDVQPERCLSEELLRERREEVVREG